MTYLVLPYWVLNEVTAKKPLVPVESLFTVTLSFCNAYAWSFVPLAVYAKKLNFNPLLGIVTPLKDLPAMTVPLPNFVVPLTANPVVSLDENVYGLPSAVTMFTGIETT